MAEIIMIERSKISQLRTDAGQSKKKIENSAQEFFSTPESGRFGALMVRKFIVKGKEIIPFEKATTTQKSGGKVVGSLCFPVYNASDEIIGYISENALTAQYLGEELTKIKSGKREGKYALKSDRLTDLSKFGASADERLFKMQGKYFTSRKEKDCRVYKSEYLDPIKFDEVCSSTNTESDLKAAMDKTETKDLYSFDVQE